VAVAVIVVVLLVGWRTYAWYTDPVRIRNLVQDYIQGFVSGPATIASAELISTGRLRLGDVRIARAADPSAPRSGVDKTREPRAVLSCPAVELTFSPLGAIFGHPDIDSVVVTRPTISLAVGTLDDMVNVSRLRLWGTEGRPRTPRLPSIELKNSRIVFAGATDGGEAPEGLTLSITANVSRSNDRLYDIDWRSDDATASWGRCRCDVTSGEFESVWGGSPWLSIDQVVGLLGAFSNERAAVSRLKQWRDRLAASGSIRLADFHVATGTADERGVWGTIELRQADLSIPIDDHEATMPADQRCLRFHDVGGELRFSPDGLVYHLAASFHDGACDLAGRFGGKAWWREPGTCGFELHADARGLVLPSRDEGASEAHARLIRGVRALTILYNDYDPSGPVDVRMSLVKRAGEAQSVHVPYLRVTALGGQATCRFFPYRATDVTGTVEYSPDGVFVDQLHARHGDGSFTVNAWVGGTRRHNTARVHITGSAVKLDRDLYDALPESYRRVFDRFQPAGAGDVTVVLARPEVEPGRQGDWRSEVTARLHDVSATCDRFPYALDDLNGSLVIKNDVFTLNDLRGRHDDATITLDGTITFAHSRVSDLNIDVGVAGASPDDSLLAALPAEQRRLVESLDARGTFDAHALLTFDHDKQEVTYQADLKPTGLLITQPQFPVRIECTGGVARITPEKLSFDRITARHDDAELLINGDYRFDDTPPGTRIVVSAERLRLDENILAALPPQTRQTIEAWRIDGLLSTETTISRAEGDQADGFRQRHVVRLKGASVTHRAFATPLTDVHAEVTIDEQGVRAQSVKARYGESDVRLDLHVPNRGEERRDFTASVDVIGLPFDDALLEILPPRARAVLEALAPKGVVDLRIDELNCTKTGAESEAAWSVRGVATLRDLDLNDGVDLKDADLTISFAGELVDSQSRCLLHGTLEGTGAKLLKHHVADLRASWSLAVAADGHARFAIEDLEGTLHEGMLRGDVEVIARDGNIAYHVGTTICDADMATFLDVYQAESNGTGGAAKVRGRADARLDLTGTIGDTSKRRGAGYVRITDAHMYRLPVLLAILHVINLTIPDDSAFHDVEARFLVTGDKLEFENILLHGRALALVGTGSMHLPSRHLDLYLATVSPHRWAKVPMLTEFLEAASRELIELHVTGPLSRPKVKAGPLRSLKGLIETLFQPKKRATIAPTLKP